jgi:hypothetical protein
VGAKAYLPAGLPAEIGRPLIEAAQSVEAVAPWEFMSDLEVIGLREESTGELHLASILGGMGTLFAVVIYRHDAGLRWIHNVLMDRTAPDPSAGLEDMDFLKVEWTTKRELQKPDLVTLAIDRVHVGEHTCVVGIGIEQALIVTGRGRERERHPGHDLLIGYADSLDVSTRSWW